MHTLIMRFVRQSIYQMMEQVMSDYFWKHIALSGKQLGQRSNRTNEISHLLREISSKHLNKCTKTFHLSIRYGTEEKIVQMNPYSKYCAILRFCV